MNFKKTLELQTTTVFLAGFTAYLNGVYDIDVPPDQFWFCTLATTVLFTATLCSALFLVSMTFDRFYGIIRPHKAASFNTVRRAKITIVCIVIFSTLFNIPNLFMTEHEGRRCVPYVTGIERVYGKMYYWLSFTINFILPFLMLLVMNSFIIHVIRKSSNFRNKHDTENEGQGKGQIQSSKVKNSDIQVFAILLLVTFGFMIFITPSYVFFIYVMLYDYTQSPRSFAFFNLFHHIAHKTYFTNYGINFYLYVMSGAKFRADVLKLFVCKKDKPISTNSQSHPTELKF